MKENIHQINRRDFLRKSLVVGAAAAAFPMAGRGAEDPVKTNGPAKTNEMVMTTEPAKTAGLAKTRHANDIIELGPGKLKVSRMAIGTGTYGAGGSSNQLRALGVDGVADLWWSGFDKGVFLLDTADTYGTHGAIKVLLKKVPREKVVIMTKTEAESAAEMKADLDRYKLEMGVDHIDIVLLHSIFDSNWEQTYKAQMDVLSEAKSKKTVGMVGLSCHEVGVVEAAIKSAWVDVVMARINAFGIRMDDRTSVMLPLLAKVKAAGKGLVGIKTLGEGELVGNLNDALKFALGTSPVDCFSIGCESKDQFQDNFDRIAKLAVPV
jgi:predicted aldo/keto reductase-like oxidoreductase